MLSQAYCLLHEFDVAREVCEAGLGKEYEGTDMEAMQEHQEGLEQLRQALTVIEDARRQYFLHDRVTKAQGYMEQEKWGDAVTVLEQNVGTTAKIDVKWNLGN